MADSPVLDRVRSLVAPIASDLHLDIYDIEQRGGTLRITLESQATAEPIDLEQIALATRLISTEFDHSDPIPGKYTLEVSSPGIERVLRTPGHFARAVGETVSVRMTGPDADGQRRFEGRLVGADATTLTIATDDGERTLAVAEVQRAKTTFDWSPPPKPGKGPKKAAAPSAVADDDTTTDSDDSDDPDVDAGHDGTHVDSETETP